MFADLFLLHYSSPLQYDPIKIFLIPLSPTPPVEKIDSLGVTENRKKGGGGRRKRVRLDDYDL